MPIIHRNTKQNGNTIACYLQCESYNDFMNFLQEKGPAADRKYAHMHRGHDRRFTGTNDLAHAMKLAREGWPEGLKKAQELSSRIENRLFSYIKQRKPEYRFAGGIPDVGVFLANDPEPFIAFHEVEAIGRGKLARIVCNVVASAGFTQEQLIMRGVAVLAVVDAMEKQGRSCEVVAVESINSYGAQRGQWEIEVPIKRAGESADLDRMAFVLAHPSFLRRLIFCAQDILDLNDSGYGQCRETLLDQGDLYFGQMSWDQAPRTDDLLLEWVLGMLKAQGVELEDA